MSVCADLIRDHAAGLARQWEAEVRVRRPESAPIAEPEAFLRRLADWLDERDLGTAEPTDGAPSLAEAAGASEPALAAVIDAYRDLRSVLVRAGCDVVALYAGFDVLVDGVVDRRVDAQSAALRESEERVRLAADASGIGLWEYDVGTGRRRSTLRAQEMFGIRTETATEEQVVGAIHPDDRAGWEAALREAMDPGKRAEYRMEYRVRDNDGAERWLASVGRAFFVDERPVRLLGAVRDITAQKVAETERELFLGALGHDLRNPLTVISVSAAMLLRRPDPATEKMVARIADSAARMKAMIRDLLEFARTRAGGLRLRRTHVDLGVLCRELLEQLELAHPGRQFTLECPVRVEGDWDRDRLAQVIDNLVGNAIAHGYADTAVSIAIRAHAGGVALEVANRGAPIPESIQPHLFDAFRRGTARGQGLGLGLYIVREIVAAHGGTVAVHSDERETRFCVNLACLSTAALLEGLAMAP